MATTESHPLGLSGIEFVEFASPNPQHMHDTFLAFGFSRLHRHKTMCIDDYQQNDIHFFLNQEEDSFAAHFAKAHGPCICSMGWRVANAEQAFQSAVSRGARPFSEEGQKSIKAPAIYGIGDSLIYFIDQQDEQKAQFKTQFAALESPDVVEEKGFLIIDHLTNNVFKGTMEEWSNFYKDVFGFTEVRTFDIRGS